MVLHVDMDAFFASVEQRDRPEWRGLPGIVGGAPDRRGVVCAASYEARRFGVRSAQPTRTAARLCPSGIFVPPRMERYREESRAVMAILADTGAVIEQVSVDEAYLEWADGPRVGDPDAALRAVVPVAEALRGRIRRERGLTASIGVAPNKFLAKVASDHRKPDGLTVIPGSGRALFLRPLPVRAIHGVGRVTGEVLERAGLRTIADLQDHRGDLRALVGSWGPQLKRLAFGEDDRPLDLGDEVRSVSAENTFDVDTTDRGVLRACLRELAGDVAGRLARRRLEARTVHVKVRYGDFTTLTRQVSLDEAVSGDRDLYRLGCWLLARDRLADRPLRLLGLGAGGLRETGMRQMAFRWSGGLPG